LPAAGNANCLLVVSLNYVHQGRDIILEALFSFILTSMHIGSLIMQQINKRCKSEYGRKTARMKVRDVKILNKLQKTFINEASSDAYKNMREAFMESMAAVWR